MNLLEIEYFGTAKEYACNTNIFLNFVENDKK